MTKNGFFDKQKAADLTDLLARDGATIIPQKMTLGSQIGLIVIRPAALGSFEINSDLDSRIAEYEARKKSSEGLAGGFFAISVCYVSLSITLEAMTGLMGLALAFLAFAFAHYRPVPRYKKIIKKLKAERDISEI
jgi:hypothetical protein